MSVLVGEDARGKEWHIPVGLMIKPGKDLPPGKNFADYIDARDSFDLTKLLFYYKKSLFTL